MVHVDDFFTLLQNTLVLQIHRKLEFCCFMVTQYTAIDSNCENINHNGYKLSFSLPPYTHIFRMIYCPKRQKTSNKLN